MSTKIFYFTGSGNSLAIARSLAARLKDAEIFPMAKSLGGFAGTDEERIGLVMPVYAWGAPRLVVDFTKGLRPKEGQYVFAVADCFGSQGRTLVRLRKLLRANGSDLNAGFAVRGDFAPPLPGMNADGIIRFIGWLGRRRVPAYARERLPEIVEAIASRRDRKPETSNLSVNIVSSPIYLGAMRVFKTSDRAFAVSDACTACGICERICPRQNVRLVDGRPTWYGDCEMCYACHLWCPEKAIVSNGSSPTDPTHHPDVTLADMFLR